jgi:hypothetical protein
VITVPSMAWLAEIAISLSQFASLSAATVDTRGKKHVRKPRGQSNGAIFLSRQKRQHV